MRILFLGDVVGKPGRQAIRSQLPRLIHREQLALVVANCENVASGAGVDPRGAQELLDAGVDVLTSGNHVWRGRRIFHRPCRGAVGR
jgi:calcineurin-like phosphoesterase